jgi:hypothetical protein
MKFKLNRAFRATSGELDGLIYRMSYGKVVASPKPEVYNFSNTEVQLQHRERFKQAAIYGKSALADDEARAVYEEVAKEKNIPLFATTIADFFNAPVIHKVDVFGYNGEVGDTIVITASDDVGVQMVHVSISDDQGNPIEHGEAVEFGGQWIYTATVQGQPIARIQVVAQDRPGGTAMMNIDKTF